METLFLEGMLRLAGRSDQAAFELAQAMGGGKTHLMVAIGLLAKYPDAPFPGPPHELADLDFGSARGAAFNSRNDLEHYIWGEIAEQLGQHDLIRPPICLSVRYLPLLPCFTWRNGIMAVLGKPHWQGWLTPRDYAALTPLIWEHVNPYGRFDLDMESRLPLD